MLQKQYKPKIKLQIGENYKFVRDIVKDQNLNTVCAEANCPNIYECWNRGTATLMILGDTCLLYTSPSPRDRQKSRMPSSA